MLTDRRNPNLPYLIAEIGQNHNGSRHMGEELIRMAADSRSVQAYTDAPDSPRLSASAVKFTKRKLTEEMTEAVALAPYEVNSFGATYGEHRRRLELGWDEFSILAERAYVEGVDFGVTVCHPDLVDKALEYCLALSFIKVASRDIRNGPLLDRLVKVPDSVPIVVSLGMANETDLSDVLRRFRKKLDSLTVLHCRSIYPAKAHTWDLGVIPALRHRLEPLGVQVGYSDHSIGNAACMAAVAMGAQVIEKHITLDRRSLGGDHLGSLDRGGLSRLVRDLERVSLGIGNDSSVRMHPEAEPARRKLARSLAWRSTLTPGTVVEEGDLCLLSPGNGLDYTSRGLIVGKTVVEQVERHTLCELDQVS